jgi:hypothetical protein
MDEGALHPPTHRIGADEYFCFKFSKSIGVEKIAGSYFTPQIGAI